MHVTPNHTAIKNKRNPAGYKYIEMAEDTSDLYDAVVL